MGLFKRFRSRHNLKASQQIDSTERDLHYPYPSGIDYSYKLTPVLLSRIFSYICPHSADFSFETYEDVVVDNAQSCFLCDTRDLANCARVKKTWYRLAQEILYQSVRFDQCHYCDLEEVLLAQRLKNGGRKARKHEDDDYVYNADSDPALERLRIFTTVLRDVPWLGSLVQYVKIPNLIRESRKMELAQLVSRCPRLQYIDLPLSFYEGDKTTELIRSEMWANCPDIRDMKYMHGSAPYFEMMAYKNQWTALERLEMDGIRIDLAMFRDVIATLPYLQCLRLSSIPDANDDLFSTVPGIVPFPQIPTLELLELPSITTGGIVKFLTEHSGSHHLTSLTLQNTGVSVPDLHQILSAATNLESLTIISEVSKALPLEPLPPLASDTLQTLHYEITSGVDTSSYPDPVGSYHKYLLDSVIEMTLPALRALYVRDPGFPEALLQAGTIRSRNSMAHHRNISTASARSFTSNGPPSPHHSSNGSHQSAPRSPLLNLSNNDHQPTLIPPNPAFLSQDPYARHSLVVPQGTPAKFRTSHVHTSSTSAPRRTLRQPLEVFTKSQHDSIGDWLSRPIDPAPPRGASPRPQSHFNAEWAAHARRSVMVADGEGGFLAVPELTLVPAGMDWAMGGSSTGLRLSSDQRPGTGHSHNSFRGDDGLRGLQVPWAAGDGAAHNRRSRFEPGKVGDLW